MRLFLVLPKNLPISNALVLEHAKGLMRSFAQAKEVQIILVGDQLEDALVEYGQQWESVVIQSTKEAAQFIKTVTNAVVFHFGTQLNWAKGFPQYFIPLVLPKEGKRLSILKRYLFATQFEKWMKLSTKVLATSDWAYEQLSLHYPAHLSKFQMLSFPLPEAISIEWHDLAATRARLTRDHNYFLVFAPGSRFVDILKAFSVFKKWQQTTMHLVFVFDTTTEVKLASEQLRGYKFKADVSIHHNEAMDLSWLAAAYAVLWEGVSYAHAMWMEYAIQMDIPLWLDAQLTIPTSWHSSGEVFPFSEKMALSNHFKLYYKDELYRQSIANKGKEWLIHQHPSDSHLDLFNKIVLSLNN